jgi:cytochrome c oxidase cbb3-type subunit III
MRLPPFRFACFAVAMGIPLLVLPSLGQRPADKPLNGNRGQKLFAENCAGCHGLDGRGGERAPDIAGRPQVQRLSNSQIFHIIQDGVPETGMPAFHSLPASDIQAVVACLRILQRTQSGVELPGNAERGKALFYGKAECSACHMVAGSGGFIASDLSAFARTHSVEEIRSSITRPEPGASQQAKTAVATTRSGDKYTGRVRNEDNFSLQMQSLDGTFHLLAKSDLASLEFDPQPLMPSDYSSRLSPSELNDVISFLMSSSKKAHSEETPEKTPRE